jgi:hypothetical protein
MSFLTDLKTKMNGGERVTLVWSREHHIEIVACTIDSALKLVRDGAGRSWPKPEFDPKPAGKDLAYFAIGEKIVPWPTKEKPAYDVDDEGNPIEITPEYLDQLTRDSDTEAWLRGVRGISMWERITHIGLGAAGGMILTFLLLKVIGFVGAHASGSGTTVTITNTTATNATSVAMLAFPHVLPFALKAVGF